jgi:hypothetical protein
MIFWYTDNSVCQAVRKALESGGVKCDHIKHFDPYQSQEHIFYGILRGAGHAIKLCERFIKTYYYIDNGYFDARYIDAGGFKELDGKFRVVKNGQIEPFTGSYTPFYMTETTKFLILPPSEYSAYFHNTTPEDWILDVHLPYSTSKIRKKNDPVKLDADIEAHEAVIAYNSMAVIRAIELGKPVVTERGAFDKLGTYDLEEVREFYKDKQFTLQELAEGKWTS